MGSLVLKDSDPSLNIADNYLSLIKTYWIATNIK